MLITKERIGLILERFSMFFALPSPEVDRTELVNVWARLFSDCEGEPFDIAARALALKLRRFPVPADFVEEMAQTNASKAPAATESVA